MAKKKRSLVAIYKDFREGKPYDKSNLKYVFPILACSKSTGYGVRNSIDVLLPHVKGWKTISEKYPVLAERILLMVPDGKVVNPFFQKEKTED